MHRPATIRLRTSLFEDAVAIVETEYASDLSLDDIARRVASSRRQLQRAYSEIGETTFREHLTAVRMDRAAELLRIRGLTVRDVAHRVGYRQPAQFAKAFRRHHGIAPSDFRASGRFSRRRRLTAPDGAAAERVRLSAAGASPRPAAGQITRPRSSDTVGVAFRQSGRIGSPGYG